MSTRVHSNIGHGLERRLPQIFSGNALGSANPNTLNGNKPTLSDAMALCRKSGIVSFAHDAGSQLTLTVYMWSDVVFKATSGATGWVLLGASSGEYTKTVDSLAVASVTVPEGALLFIQGSATAANLYLGGADRYNGNPHPDL